MNASVGRQVLLTLIGHYVILNVDVYKCYRTIN